MSKKLIKGENDREDGCALVMNLWYWKFGFDKAGSRDRRRGQPEKQRPKIAEDGVGSK
jgi:hypothetical protein